MLLIASESIRRNRSLNDVVREMSFTLSFYASPATFAELMLGQSRRIVVMTENDVTPEALRTLKGAQDRAPFGVIVAADRAKLRNSKQAELGAALPPPHAPAVAPGAGAGHREW